jgi:hypothetical protein
MKYKVKETNLSKLKNYIDANTKTKSEREAERFYDTMCGRDEKEYKQDQAVAICYQSYRDK